MQKLKLWKVNKRRNWLTYKYSTKAINKKNKTIETKLANSREGPVDEVMEKVKCANKQEIDEIPNRCKVLKCDQ